LAVLFLLDLYLPSQFGYATNRNNLEDAFGKPQTEKEKYSIKTFSVIKIYKNHEFIFIETSCPELSSSVSDLLHSHWQTAVQLNHNHIF